MVDNSVSTKTYELFRAVETIFWRINRNKNHPEISVSLKLYEISQL